MNRKQGSKQHPFFSRSGPQPPGAVANAFAGSEMGPRVSGVAGGANRQRCTAGCHKYRFKVDGKAKVCYY